MIIVRRAGFADPEHIKNYCDKLSQGEKMYTPETDGINHINVYSKGKTELGRLLSNFAHTPFVCDDGRFESVEGYWYWLGNKDDRLRSVYGYNAKSLGRKLPRQKSLSEEEFKTKIKIAINKKIKQNNLMNVLAISRLPFVHYYAWDGHVKDAGYRWIVDHITTLRKWLQEHGYPKY